MNRCPHCQSEVANGARFCPRCGADISEEFLAEPTCPRCGTVYSAGTRRCETDGTRLVSRDRAVPRCANCGESFPEGTRYCPRDGGPVLPEALRRGPGAPFDTGRKLDPGELDSLRSREYAVRPGAFLRRGWELFRENPGGYAGFTALAALLQAALSQVPVVGWAVSLAAGPLWAGLFVVACLGIRRRRTSFGDFFRGFRYFLPLLLASLLTTIFVAAGLLLLLVPGIYLAVSYVFVMPLIVDRRMDFWQALEASRKVATKRWFRLFGFLLLVLLVNLAGALAALVGLLVSVPVSFGAVAALYDEAVGIESVDF